TDFLVTYITGRCPETFVPTVFENYSKNVIIGGEPCCLSLWDTSGNEDFDRLRPLSYDQTDVFLICFSVVSPDSFDNLKEKWFPEMQHFCPGIPFLIIGTKIDLRDDPLEIRWLSRYDQRPITSEEGRKLAQKLGAIKYVECSARTQRSVENVFDETISALKSLNKKPTFKNQTVALKEFFGTHDRSTFFLDEVEVNVKINVEIYGITYSMHTKKYMMVGRYADKGDLRHYLSKNFAALNWKQKLKILHFIISDLASIHKKEYIHKDLHSGNILLFSDSAGDVETHIYDFGLSEKADCSTICGEIY
ncbi:12582_t:CDS:2, partial [Gigaspora margarita]